MEVFDSLKTSYITKLVLEYGKLSVRECLSEDEVNRMTEILILATNDPILDFWLSEVEHCIGHHLGLLESKHRNYYRDQQALLSEYAEVNIPSHSIAEITSHSSVSDDEVNSVNTRVSPNCLNIRIERA